MDDVTFWRRVEELQRDSELNFRQALQKANLERNINIWPSEWGDNVLVVIYGDFIAPSEDVILPALGIKIDHNNKRDSKFNSAQCVLDVWIRVEEKSASAVLDAVRRLNIFLGLWTISGGCRGCSWWSSVIDGLIKSGAGYGSQDITHLDPACSIILELPDNVRQKVAAALYWVRAPRNLSMNYYLYENDLLRVYSGYWNAFECLVDAVDLIKPKPSFPPSKKQEEIDRFVAMQITDHYKLTSEDIQNCYNKIVNPGFKGKAINALKTCFPDPTYYIKECFEMPEKRDSLYQIRNAINHGNIDSFNPEELLRIEWRFSQLNPIVLGMLFWILNQKND
jgi:hypothetical protein